MKILIIEDEEAIRETLQCLLEFNGHTVLAAANGPAGILLAQARPDLILSDIGLPGMDGFETMAAIQKLPGCREVPFVFLTARADRADQRRGMTLGADDYITKPFTEDEILAAIDVRARRRQTLQERITELVARPNPAIGANWSHELMTPLTGVLGGLEIIEEEVDTIKPGELRELLALIRTAAMRQLALAQKLVLYYELEKIKSAAPSGPCPVSEAMLAAADRINQIEHGGSRLKVQSEPADVKISQSYLIAALSEVIGNALRFSRDDQPVVVHGRKQADRYLIEIIDRGMGMTPAQCAGIGPFVQFDRNKHEQQGLGLGLAIARMVAEMAGGRLEPVPGEGGVGLTVRIELACA